MGASTAPPAAWLLRRAADVVAAGGLIGYPAEGVYGLGCSPWDRAAVGRLRRLKQRTTGKGLIILAGGLDQIRRLLRLPGGLPAELRDSWPGPVTWVVPCTAAVPRWVRGTGRGAAFRVSASPLLAALCAHCGPLISTSANPAGRAPARDARRARRYFGAAVDFYLPGTARERSGPTEIRDLASGALLRKGG